jgi:nitrate/nitrite-specific signal transduction histidine kinase
VSRTAHEKELPSALGRELERTSAELVVEREHRARLAIAGERSRIARELHSLVARGVAAMVIQTEAAQSRLDLDLAQAEAAMDVIESTFNCPPLTQPTR